MSKPKAKIKRVEFGTVGSRYFEREQKTWGTLGKLAERIPAGGKFTDHLSSNLQKNMPAAERAELNQIFAEHGRKVNVGRELQRAAIVAGVIDEFGCRDENEAGALMKAIEASLAVPQEARLEEFIRAQSAALAGIAKFCA